MPIFAVSYFLDGRDAGQLIYRWTQVLDPNIKKGPWSKDEDEVFCFNFFLALSKSAHLDLSFCLAMSCVVVVFLVQYMLF